MIASHAWRSPKAGTGAFHPSGCSARPDKPRELGAGHDDEAHPSRRGDLAPLGDAARVEHDRHVRDPDRSQREGLADEAQAEAALSLPIMREAARAARVFREVPISYIEEDRLLEGVCDLAFEDEKGWVVVDYKTEAIGEDQVLAVPTLIRQRPVPVRRLVGDLADVDRVVLLSAAVSSSITMSDPS